MKFATNITLLPHQQEASEWMLQQEAKTPSGGILAHDMGLGKTVTTLYHLVHRVAASTDFTQSLVVVPTNLLNQWREEMRRFISDFDTEYICFWTSQNRCYEQVEEAEIVVTTYDTLAADDGRRESTLFRRKWERIILDEAHEIRNMKSKRHHLVQLFNAKTKWCLTGTPIWNSRKDLIALYNFIGGNLSHEIIDDKSYMHIRGKEQLTLPELDIRDFKCEFSESRLEHYKKFEKRMLKSRLCGRGRELLGNIIRLRRVCNDIPEDYIKKHKNPDEVNVKFQRVYELVDNMPESDKIVIFSQWSSTLIAFKRHLELMGHNAISMFHGEMSQEARQKSLDEFKTGSNNVLLITIKCGGVGLNLVCANRIVMMEPQYSPFSEKQAIDRVYRIGQTRPVHVFRVFINETIEHWMNSIKNWKSVIKRIELDNSEEDEQAFFNKKIKMFQTYVSQEKTILKMSKEEIAAIVAAPDN
jgi:SNF2 family DNA or RNA helicase